MGLYLEARAEKLQHRADRCHRQLSPFVEMIRWNEDVKLHVSTRIRNSHGNSGAHGKDWELVEEIKCEAG